MKTQDKITINTPVSCLPYINAKVEKLLNKLGIKTICDLLMHSPSRYLDFSNVVEIENIPIGEICTIQGQIISVNNKRTWKRGLNITEAIIGDDTGQAKAVWFNQPFIAHKLSIGQFVSLSGKATIQNNELNFSHPTYETLNKNEILSRGLYFSHQLGGDRTPPALDKRFAPLRANSTSPLNDSKKTIRETIHTGMIVPVYPETAGMTSKWIRFLMKQALRYAAELPEILPAEIKTKEKFLDKNDVVKNLHFPPDMNAAKQAKKQFAFEELFLIQLIVLGLKKNNERQKAPAIKADIELIKNFLSRLPFQLTAAQKKSAWQILQDMEKPHPMNRLLNGDVGSGKTIVAAIAALSSIKQGYQVAYLAPTEILARQHFATFCKFLQPFNIHIALATGSENKIFEPELNDSYSVKNRDLTDEIAGEKIGIAIGTHALLQDKIKFNNLGLVIIDEQHRFGVNQRKTLVRGTNAEQTQNNAEIASTNNELLYEELTYKIRQALFDVKKELGGGHKEIIYQKAFANALENLGLKFSREEQIPIIYKDKKVGTYIPDFVVENNVIVELKALTFTGSIEKKQIWNYLKGSKYHLALLANFGPKELTINRIIYDSARSSAFVPRKSAYVPHLLSMTATPIPRTLMLTVYGDLDISILNEMPSGRKKIITKIISPKERLSAYEFIRQQIKEGRQSFVICPRIELTTDDEQLTTNNSEIKTVKDEYKKLSEEIFPNLKVAMIHGKIKPKEKEKIMADFKNNKTDILVSTSVIEVGIDIPNASIMMIEGAERFGLAQLHQFRGRVGRGVYQSYCFLMVDSDAKIEKDRLQAMAKSENGFELAERDLEIRGPGEFLGTRQSGIADTAFAASADIFTLEKVRKYAMDLFKKDSALQKHPILKEELDKIQQKIHLE